MSRIWPIRTWQPKEIVQDWKLNEVSFNLDAVRNPPCCSLAQSDPVNVDDGDAYTTLTWDTVEADTDEMSGNTRITFNTPGVYAVNVRTAFSPTSSGMTVFPFTGYIALGLNMNGQFQWGQGGMIGVDMQSWNGQTGNTSTGMRLTISAKQRFIVGDYVEVFAARHGGTATITCSGNSSTKDGSFTALWISR